VRLLPDYLRELAETEAHIADLHQQREAFEQGGEVGNDSEEAEENGEGKRNNYAKELEDLLRDTRAALRDAEKRLQQTKRNTKGSSTAQYAQTLPLFAETVPDKLDDTQTLAAEVETLRQEITRLDAQLQPYREIRANLSVAQQHLRKLKQALIQRIKDAYTALTLQQCEDMILDIAHDDIADELERYLLVHRQQVIAVIENWWDKYRINLQAIRSARDFAEKKFDVLMKELGYA
jgi:type I restriction enzyme M protein